MIGGRLLAWGRSLAGGWQLWAAGAVLLAGVFAAGFKQGRDWGETRAAARLQQQWQQALADERAKQQQAQQLAAETARRLERARGQLREQTRRFEDAVEADTRLADCRLSAEQLRLRNQALRATAAAAGGLPGGGGHALPTADGTQ